MLLNYLFRNSHQETRETSREATRYLHLQWLIYYDIVITAFFHDQTHLFIKYMEFRSPEIRPDMLQQPPLM